MNKNDFLINKYVGLDLDVASIYFKQGGLSCLSPSLHYLLKRFPKVYYNKKRYGKELHFLSYTYYLYNKITKQKYYGVRYGNWLSPEEDLWNCYFSSSKKVKSLIDQYGKDSFEREVRKIFTDIKTAMEWEYRVLTKLKIWKKQDIWLNENIASTRFFATAKTPEQIEKHKKSIKEHHINHPETREQMRKSRVFRNYIFKHKDGRIVYTDSLCKFAADHGIIKASLCKVVKGTKRSIKGWTGVIVGQEHLREYIENHKMVHHRGKEHWTHGIVLSEEHINKLKTSHFKYFYTITSPDNEIFEDVLDLKKFSEKHGLKYDSLCGACRTNAKLFGWKITRRNIN